MQKVLDRGRDLKETEIERYGKRERERDTHTQM